MSRARNIAALPATELSSAPSLRKVVLTVFFLICLYPVTIDGLSVNYGFVLLPIMALLLYRRLRNPPEFILPIAAVLSLIFVYATFSQFELLDLGLRRFVSFLLFMTLFSFTIVKIDSEMIAAFKIAVVAISAGFSLVAVSAFVEASAVETIGYEAKDLVGSQRYGFIYLLGFWIAFFFQRPGKLYMVGKYAVMGILLTGLFLTFSRSSIVALLVSFGLFMLVSQWKWLLHPTGKGILKTGQVVAYLGLLVLSIYYYFPLTFDFYGDRLFSFVSSESLVEHLADEKTSEGMRIHIIRTVMDFVLANPLTGSGYLGVWILPDANAGSAHNQYIDVLFRTGFIGFGVYCFLMLKMLKQLSRHERAMFWGLVGILVYGAFHETFKESQGAFVLAFMLGLSSFKRRKEGQEGSNPIFLRTISGGS